MTASHLINSLVGDNVPSADDDAPVAPPSRATGATLALVEVWPHDVAHGDIIDGLTLPVESILTDGRSWFYGARGTFVAIRSTWGRVKVWREVAPVSVRGGAPWSENVPAPATQSTAGGAAPHGLAPLASCGGEGLGARDGKPDLLAANSSPRAGRDSAPAVLAALDAGPVTAAPGEHDRGGDDAPAHGIARPRRVAGPLADRRAKLTIAAALSSMRDLPVDPLP